MINFQNEMQNLEEFTHFKKFIFIQQWLTQNMLFIGAIICIFNNKLQKILFKKKFIWKNEQGLNKIHSPFVIVILLTPFLYLHLQVGEFTLKLPIATLAVACKITQWQHMHTCNYSQ